MEASKIQQHETASSAAITKRLWQLAYPTMISMGLQSFYDIVDMAWVGRVSQEALSGVTLFSTIYMLFNVLNEIAGGGSVAMISQSYGRGDKKRTQLISEQTITFKIVLALIAMVAMLLLIRPILSFYTKDAEVIKAAYDYGYIRIFFFPMMFSSYSVNTIFRCTQDAKTPMRIMLISGVLNLILDPIMMFETVPFVHIPGLGLGVFGAALATVIATTVSFLYGFTILVTGRRDVTISLRGLLRLDRKIDRQLMLIGFPIGVQLFVRQFFLATMMKFVTVYGTSAVALAGISGKLNGFMLQPIFGLNNAAAALVGASLGQGRIREAERVSDSAVRLNVGVVAVIALFCAVFARQVMRIFTEDAEVIAQGIPMIQISAVGLLFVAYSFGKKVAFSGSGYNRPQLVAVVIGCWCVQLPAMMIIAQILHLPLVFFWTAMLLGQLADAIVTTYYYHQPTWRLNRV